MCIFRRYVPTFFPCFTFFIAVSVANANSQLPSGAEKKIEEQSVNRIEQDKIRKEQLRKGDKKDRSAKEDPDKYSLFFPTETPCYPIDKVLLHQNTPTIAFRGMNYFTRQAQGKCLGIQGIRVLADAIQNEIIRLGFITTRISMPDQNLHSRELRFDITPGTVGKIRLNREGANDINLKTTLPFSEGEVLNLSDLEQGSFNLQRVPGSQVNIRLVPGTEKGESDVLISRYQDKYWQLSGWVNDAGSKTTGRYQAGVALYLNNMTSLSDSLYVSVGHDLSKGGQPQGNSNQSIGYSVPWGYWSLDLYGSQSRYQQYVQGNYTNWMLNNKNYYYSAQLNRLLSHTVKQKSTLGLQIFSTGSRYFYNDQALDSLHKENAGWKAILQHQRYFERAVVAGSLSYQKKMPWFGSQATLEQKQGVIDSEGRILTANLQASLNFSLSGQVLNYSPDFTLQLSPDRLSSLSKFSVGNRWTVRGFDGETSLQENQGWYWRNDLSWVLPETRYQPYIGLDFGQVKGNSSQQFYSGKTLVGSVAGLRGSLWKTHYDLFAGIPLKKPCGFHSDPLTLGFSLQWTY